MKIDEFCLVHGQDSRTIDVVCETWTASAVDGLLAKLDQEFIGEAVLLGDAIHGDGIRDQIPKELKDAFIGLMKNKADTYAEMRQILKDKIRDSDGGFLSFNDPHVRGFVSKLKGQVGENQFQKVAGKAARLATSGSQEGWDVVISKSDGAHEYVQVKTYSNANAVVNHMSKIHEKLAIGAIEGVDGETVESINFAVPENIVDEVKQRIADRFPELSDVKLHTIRHTAKTAAGVVEEGLGNVGPEQLEHLFGELLGGSLIAGSIHAMVNGFLWYKGAKDADAAFEDTISNTALSASGIAIGLLADSLTACAPIAGVVGVGGRAVISRFARSRWNFADFLEDSIKESEEQIARLSGLDFEPIEQRELSSRDDGVVVGN